MTLDGGWGLIIAGLLCAVVTAAGALIWRHVDNAQKDAEKAIEETMALNVNFLQFQTHVAETYARILGVERMETNIFAVMSRFETKLDKLLENRSQHHG
jgi:hypothetical protein